MTLGLIPNQDQVLSEMVRVLKSEGTLSISTHGPELYFEACEATFRALPKNIVLGYRVEFWPREEKEIFHMFSKAGLKNISTQRLNWKEHFNDGGEAYDFFASTSSAWWYSRIPSDKVESISQKVKVAFEQKRITEITTDVILAYGCKP